MVNNAYTNNLLITKKQILDLPSGNRQGPFMQDVFEKTLKSRQLCRGVFCILGAYACSRTLRCCMLGCASSL